MQSRRSLIDTYSAVLCDMETKEVVAKIREGKKRKFDQSVDLIVNLKNFDVRREALNTFIFVPNGSQKKLAGFFTKRSKHFDTITEEDFVKYKDLKDIKKLAKKYDMFLAVAPMMSKVATKFGRVFGPMNKMPSPLAGIVPAENDDAVKSMVAKMNKAIRIKNKEMAVKFSVGKESMKDEDIVANIDAALVELEKKLPKGKENVREVLVKLTMGAPVVLVEKK